MLVQRLLYVVVMAMACGTPSGGLNVPNRPLGFFFGGPPQSPSVEVVAYLDITCPDSKAVYPTLLMVASNYKPSQVQLRVHLFSMPFHRHSHTLSKAALVLDLYQPNGDTAFKWMSLVYSNIDSLSTSGTYKQSDEEVLNLITNLARNLTGIKEDTFVEKVKDTSIDQMTRLDFKYGCTRGVYAVPSFTINDIFTDASTWTFDQWKTFLDSLLQ
ncbi:eppin [Plakobranchus ocellatus]|uniref:Eppin n=1 Tax=Plakobranchus ocellatus TaxID=259542 RepID=A0AAV4A082_9GAST|nr:eppin [Plakobranchus ocellatus]